MSDRGNAKAIRILVLIVSLIAMIALGSTTPSGPATMSSRIIVFAFAFSLAIVMVTTVALMPSPPDPRERRRRILNGLEQEPEETDDDNEPEFAGFMSAPRQHQMRQAGGDDG